MKKKLLLAALNIAAAAAIGIIVGIYVKYGRNGTSGQDSGETLYGKIEAIAGQSDARIGFAAVFHDGSMMVYSNAEAGKDSTAAGTGMPAGAYPMLSVMKFHQALAVCGWLKERGIPLTEKIHVRPEDLEQDTWSPLRDAHPDGGDFSWKELLEYTLIQSDNNACDILFARTGGPAYTDSYVRTSGARGFSIECTEAMMHENLQDCYRNWSTPESAALLMDKFYKSRDNDVYSRFIWETMSGCKTGQDRIPRYISEKAAAVAHKTGTGDMTPDGRIMAINDIGTVVLPGGRHFSMAVFVNDAGCSAQECAGIIAGIAGAVYDFCADSDSSGEQRRQ